MGKGKKKKGKKSKRKSIANIYKNPARNQLKFIFQIFGFNGS